MSRAFDHVTKAGKGFGSQGLNAKAVEDRAPPEAGVVAKTVVIKGCCVSWSNW